MPHIRQAFTTFEVMTGIPNPAEGNKLSWVLAEDFDSYKAAKAFAATIPKSVAWLVMERRSKVLALNTPDEAAAMTRAREAYPNPEPNGQDI
jgi:hypothetical protein